MITRLARFAAPLLCGALVVAHASGQVTQQGGGYLFRLKLAKGLKLNYSVVYSVESPALSNGTVKVTSPLSISIVDVRAGVATINEAMGPVEMNGQKQPSRSTTIKVNSMGNAVGSKEPGMQGATMAMPEKPVKIGGSWAASIPLGTGIGQAKQVAVRYKLVRIDQVAGRKVAVLNVVVTGGAAGGGTAVISMTDGFLVKTDMTIKLSVPRQGGGQSSVTAIAKVARN